MNRAETLVGCVLLCGLLLVGCSGGEEDEPGSGNPPAALVGTWVFESVTVNGAPQALGDVLDWQAGTVAASMTIRGNGGYSISEVDARGQQTHFENGFVYVDGNEMDLNILASDGVTIEETIPGTYTLSGDTLIFTTVEDGDAIAITLTLMAGTGGTGGTGGSAGTGGAGGSAEFANCDAYCSKAIECNAFGAGEGCERACVVSVQASINRSGPDCFNAFSRSNGCIGGLTCPQVDALIAETPPEGYPCKAEVDATAASCK